MQVILSTNEDPVYMHFWKPVSTAYKMMGYECQLAFLTRRDESDPLVEEFRKYGKVTLFRPIGQVAEFGQAKMIRFILASRQGDEVCYIDDIDLFPLSKNFIQDKVNQRPKDHILCVGGEVYNNNGCYPISQMTAEGYIWKRIIGEKPYDHFIEEWSQKGEYDRREQITIPINWNNDDYFSDERLLRRLINQSGVKRFELPRGYADYTKDTLDRACWNVDRIRLFNHEYVNAHGLRPYSDYEKEYEPLFEYLEMIYGYRKG